MKIAGIYKITSPSDKVYIGQSWTIQKRWSSYRVPKEEQRYLYRSLKKYGWEAHKFEIVHELPLDCTQEVMDRYELFYWQQYKDCGFKMLNIREPGSKGKMSEESKQLMSIAQRGNRNASKKRTPEQVERNRQANLGKINSPELMRKLWDGNKKEIIEIDENGIEIENWPSIIEAAIFYKISPKRIGDVCNNRKKRIAGFKNKFKFKEKL